MSYLNRIEKMERYKYGIESHRLLKRGLWLFLGYGTASSRARAASGTV